MYQNNFNGYYNPQAMQMSKFNVPGLNGRPVSSLEEARAATIDFDGSIFYFPDLASNKIYTKQINLDGTALFKILEYKEMTPVKKEEYVTKEEFEKALAELQEKKPLPAIDF